MTQRAAQLERVATMEAAVVATAVESTATPVAVPSTTVPDTGISSLVQPVGHGLIVADSEQCEAMCVV